MKGSSKSFHVEHRGRLIARIGRQCIGEYRFSGSYHVGKMEHGIELARSSVYYQYCMELGARFVNVRFRCVVNSSSWQVAVQGRISNAVNAMIKTALFERQRFLVP